MDSSLFDIIFQVLPHRVLQHHSQLFKSNLHLVQLLRNSLPRNSTTITITTTTIPIITSTIIHTATPIALAGPGRVAIDASVAVAITLGSVAAVVGTVVEWRILILIVVGTGSTIPITITIVARIIIMGILYS